MGNGKWKRCKTNENNNNKQNAEQNVNIEDELKSAMQR